MIDISEQSYLGRVHEQLELIDLCNEVCEAFALGNYISHTVITTGYEDLNIHLVSSTGGHLVKVFAQTRSDEECERYGVINDAVLHAGVKGTPKLYISAAGKHLHSYIQDDKLVRLCVTEFIQGETYLASGQIPSAEERKFLVGEAAKVHEVQLSFPHVYDCWCIQHLDKEYTLKKQSLSVLDHELVLPVLEKFKTLNHDALPKQFIHGDINVNNVIKDDRDGSLHIIDFSPAVANVYPRIQELAVLIAWLFFDPKRTDNTDELIQETTTTYNARYPLEVTEQETLPTYVQAVFAILVIEASYEREVNGDVSPQAIEYYNRGVAGLQATKKL